jgi:glycosyltransferase involved in cell wall biosynthesis
LGASQGGKSSGEGLAPALKLLLLSDWMSNRGGAENYIVSLRDGLRDQGDDVRLIACGPGTPRDATDTRAYGSDFIGAQAFLQVANPFAASTVRRMVREFNPEAAIVSQFAYHLSPAVFRALGGIPTVVTMMDYKAICPTGTRLLPDGSRCTVRRGTPCTRNGCIGYAHSLRDRRRYSLIERQLAGARRILCPSSAMQQEFTSAGFEAQLLPLAVRPSARLAGVPASDPLFAYVGRFSREKGVAVLITAFAQIRNEFPEARLRLIGDGPLKRQLAALAGALGIAGAVEFCGWSSAESTSARLDDAWCVICPSLWAEPFGLAAVEAVAMGIPVVVSDSGGFRDTIDERSGTFFATGDVGGLASAMRSIAQRERFAESRLPVEIVEKVRMKYAMVEHVRRMREMLSELVRGGAN